MDASGLKKSFLIEALLVTGGLLVLTKFLFAYLKFPFIQTHLASIVAVLFLYTPVFFIWRRGLSIDFLDRSWRNFSWSFLHFLIWFFLVFPPFLLIAHFWMQIVFELRWVKLAPIDNFWEFSAFQLFLVALPEEFFFRGYLQSLFHKAWGRHFSLFGVPLGHAWWVTALVFAFAHSVVTYQWWHFSIFFPALLFGFLRERTGSIIAPIFFHAASNIVMDWFGKCYG